MMYDIHHNTHETLPSTTVFPCALNSPHIPVVLCQLLIPPPTVNRSNIPLTTPMQNFNTVFQSMTNNANLQMYCWQ